MDAFTPAVTKAVFSASDHLRAVANELKFGWTFSIWPRFPQDSVIYLLGRSYQQNNDKNMWRLSKPFLHGSTSEFADDFASRLWFTYRSDFPQLCRTSESRSSDACFSMDRNSVRSGINHADVSESKSRSLLVETDSETSINSLDSTGIGYHGSRFVSQGDSSLDPSITLDGKNPRIQTNRPYRRIPLSIQTSDCGWGCMIRSGQMLLAEALVLHFLGREWRAFTKGSPVRTSEDPLYRQIIRWFHDSWSPGALLSLHRIVQMSSQYPGSWFGPSSMCTTLIKVMESAATQSDTLAQIQLYLARDRVIYRKEVMELARGVAPPSRCDRTSSTYHTGNYQLISPSASDGRSSSFHAPRAVVLLIPLMLGPDVRINPVYASLVCGLFRDPCCIGLIGGRPRHSIYVVGSEQKRQHLIYLDPHFTQPVVDISRADFSTKSWHCRIPRIMSVLNLDPSCAVGFYCRSRGELSDLLDRIPSLFCPSNTKHNHIKSSLVEVVDS